MIQVSTPDKHGFVSLGTSVDATLAAVETADYVLAVVNKHVPRAFGQAMIHSSKIDYFVQDDTPLMEAHFSEPNETETAIGKHCAALIEDGATLQMGIGAIPNAVLAQLGVPDMKIPIQYALTYPNRYACPTQPLDLASYGKLTFFPPDDATFRGLPLCRDAIRRGGLCPAALNGANEAAVALFLAGRLRFPQIAELAAEAMAHQPAGAADSVAHILKADAAAREFVRAAVGANESEVFA